MKPVVYLPDTAEAVAAYLTAALADRSESYVKGVTVSTKMPNPVPLPYVRVRRVGGQVRDVVIDRATVDALIWHTDDDKRMALGRLTYDLLLAIQNDTVGGVLLYSASDFLAPIKVPDPTDSNRHVVMTTAQVIARATTTP